MLNPERRPAALATVTVLPSRQAVSSDRNGRFRVLGLQPGLHEFRAQLRDLRSRPVAAELDGTDSVGNVELVLERDPPTESIEILLPGGGGFCFVETDSTGRQVVRILSGRATATPERPLADRVRIACHADGRWILDGWRDLEESIARGVEFDPFDSNSSIVLEGDPSAAGVQVTGPGGWDLGSLRMWFEGASVFRVGETISNLPVGEYTLRWGEQERNVRTRRGRAIEIEIEY